MKHYNMHHFGEPPPPATPPHHHWRQWELPFPNENDLDLLTELLHDEDLGKSVYRILTSCPPEIAAIAGLLLRIYECSFVEKIPTINE